MRSGGVDSAHFNLSNRLGWRVCFTPQPLCTLERTPGTNWIRGWADPRVGLDVPDKSENTCCCWESEYTHMSLVIQSVALTLHRLWCPKYYLYED